MKASWPALLHLAVMGVRLSRGTTIAGISLEPGLIIPCQPHRSARTKLLDRLAQGAAPKSNKQT